MKVSKPRGTRDFLPQDMLKRRFVEGKLREVVTSWGYGEVKTPTFESLELFTQKSGEGILGEIYNFKDKGDRDMALRPELTAPVLRMYVNEMQVEPKPLRLFYFDNCFRYERPQKGRFREFWQFGVEHIGSKNPEADAEVIALAYSMLSAVGVKGDLHIGHLGIMRKLLEDVDTETQAKVMRFIDKKEFEALAALLGGSDGDDAAGGNDVNDNVSNAGYDGLYERIMALIGLNNDSVTGVMDGVREIVGDIEAIGEFEQVMRLLDAYDVPYTVNLGIARGLDYYTGAVFEMYAEGLGAQNQVCGGGSYRLAQLFGGQDTASCGFGIGFDRIMEVCALAPAESTKVMVVSTPEHFQYSLGVLTQLRKHVCAVSDTMNRKFGAQFSYADSIGASHAVIIGEDEVGAGKVTLRDMKSGEQEMLGIDEVIERIG